MKDFKDKILFVTGGASGAGFGQAKVFSEAGCKVVIADVRQDALDEAFRVLAEEKGAEDVVDKLSEFCRGILQERGYTIERSTTKEALTLKESLGSAAESIESVIGRLHQVKDRVRAAEASSDGLTTKEELLAKLAAAL